MRSRRKIRLKTWYWGKWVLEGELDLTLNDPDVELYIESEHGWHLSEEYKLYHSGNLFLEEA